MQTRCYEAPLRLLRQLSCNGIPNMALESVNPDADDRRKREVTPVVAACPLCYGRMEVVYARNNQQVSVCIDCHTGVVIPAVAWDLVRSKREAKWRSKR